MNATTTRVHMVMLRNDTLTDSDRQAAIDYELAIFTEDRRILERLPTTEVPLDRGQVHIRSDRHTVEFRRILERLVNSAV